MYPLPLNILIAWVMGVGGGGGVGVVCWDTHIRGIYVCVPRVSKWGFKERPFTETWGLSELSLSEIVELLELRGTYLNCLYMYM